MKFVDVIGHRHVLPAFGNVEYASVHQYDASIPFAQQRVAPKVQWPHNRALAPA